MKILKELDRQAFTERFTTNQDCYEFLADLKWSEGYSCKRCGSTAISKANNLAVVAVVNAVTMNLPQQELYSTNLTRIIHRH